MAVSTYFQQTDSILEQELVNDLVEESIQIHGIDVSYMPRTLVATDNLYAEDVASKFTSAHSVEMYVESIDGFGGEGDIIGQFGVEIRDQLILTVSQRRWSDLDIEGRQRPFEGDLIYFPLNDRLFEIRFVEHEKVFYQLGNLPLYTLTCELFEYSHEDIDTGIAAIDDIENDYGYAKDIVFVRGSGNYQVDEIVTNSTTSAKVLSWNYSTRTLRIGNITGPIITNQFFTGSSSGASWSMAEADVVIQDQNVSDGISFAGDSSTSPSTDVYTKIDEGTTYNLPFDDMYVRYGDGVFVAATHEKIWSSTDGSSWTLRQTLEETVTGSAGSHALSSYVLGSIGATDERLHYDGSDFYFVNRNQILRSNDGIGWSEILDLTNLQYTDGIISNGGGKLMAFGMLGTIRYSTDYGQNWTGGIYNMGGSYLNNVFRTGFYWNNQGNDTWVLVSYQMLSSPGTRGTNMIHVSTDHGSTWTHYSDKFGPATDYVIIRSITYTGSKWIAVGYENTSTGLYDDAMKTGNPSSTDNQGVIFVSDSLNGTWNKQTLPTGVDTTSLFYDVRHFSVENSVYTFVLGTGLVLFTKDHGTTWAVLENNTNISESVALRSIAWDKVTGATGKLILGGSNNYISSPIFTPAHIVPGSTIYAAIPPAPNTNIIVTDTQANNFTIQSESDSIFDFSDRDPFSEGQY